jgi:hypothetical protein
VIHNLTSQSVRKVKKHFFLCHWRQGQTSWGVRSWQSFIDLKKLPWTKCVSPKVSDKEIIA